MDARAVFKAFCALPRSKRVSVIQQVGREFNFLISDIYSDIYTSCIKVYYTYEPTVYTRHGNKEGFNLYSGFMSSVHNTRIDTMFMPNNLLAYRGVDRVTVLEAVVGDVIEHRQGQRGTKKRTGTLDGDWPRKWDVTYPNAYSKYHIWTSKGGSIDEIMYDFDNNSTDVLTVVFWSMVARYI